jgi:hypothetical protein
MSAMRAITPQRTRLDPALQAIRRRPRELPAIALWYLVLIWSIFLVVAAIDFRGRREVADPYGYSIADLAENFPRALASLPIAPFVNVGVLQLLYVTAILAVISPRLVEREGPALPAVVFMGTSLFAGIAAGLALHAIDGHVMSHPILDEGWERSWNGGSAGCYGLVGFLAAGARRPWLMLGLIGAWEIGLTGIHLHSYTPAFHVSALAAGFVMGRLLPTRRAAPAPVAVTA